jgi:hypothetical protein
MTTFPLRLTEELKAIATAQAARAGISLNQYIATVLAAHVDVQAEAERMFAARAARARPGTAQAILARAGKRRRYWSGVTTSTTARFRGWWRNFWSKKFSPQHRQVYYMGRSWCDEIRPCLGMTSLIGIHRLTGLQPTPRNAFVLSRGRALANHLH